MDVGSLERQTHEAVSAVEDEVVDLAVAEAVLETITKAEVAVVAGEAMLPEPNCYLREGFPRR
jgi:hypothetical protein